ncbi:MAG: SMC family ATPase [Marinifilaceae bacterium]
MKPLYLKIEGLYSYQSRQEIDFSKLTEAHLFGIFGSVGSGKSSVLEAISFALYGETDKLNKKEGRPYNMMNLKSDSLYIEFDFMVEHTEYKSTVKTRRNSKNYSDVKAFERKFYKKAGEDFIPIEQKEVHEAIGLSYENFKRTIIIPQGQFKEFLELGDADRTKMLKELFNLGKYDLADKLKPLANKNSKEIENLKGQLEQLGDVNTEQVEELEKSLLVLKKEIDLLSKDLSNKQKESESLRKIKALKSKETELEKKLNDLKSKDEEFKRFEEKLKSFEYCSLNFKTDLAEYDRFKREIKAHREDLLKQNKTREDNKLALEEQKKSFSDIKKAYDTREDLKRQIEELKKIKKIVSYKTEIEDINKSAAGLKEDFKAKEKATSLIKGTCEKLTIDIEKEEALCPDITIIQNVRDWYYAERDIKKDIDRLKEDILSLEKSNSLAAKEAQVYYMSQSTDESPAKVCDLLNLKKETLKNSIKPIEEELDSLGIKKKLEEYATELKDGKACPLCGSEHHPSIMNAESVDDLLSKRRKDKAEIERNISKIESSVSNLQRHINRIEINEEQKAKSLLEKKKKSDALKTHAESFVWDKYKTPAELKIAIDLHAEKTKSIKSLNTNLKTSQKKKEQLEEELKKNEILLKKAEDKINEIASINATLTSQLNVLKLEDYDFKTGEEILDLCAKWEASFTKIIATYDSALKKIESLEASQNKLEGLISANEANLERLKKDEIVSSENLNVKLEGSDYNTIQEIRDVLSTNINAAAQRAKIEDYKRAVSTATAELTSLKTELEGKSYDETKYLELENLIKELTVKNNTANSEMGRIQANLDKLNKDLTKLKDLKKKEEELNLRAADLATLNKLFKGNGFVNYVSSVHLRNLCAAANDRFHILTGRKLSLEMTDNNNFQVRDYMNGGNVRSVKTLSGGQSFQASLALALALTDSIQTFTQSKQNFFFLDEGFGSLDKAALATVFETLKSLKKENRVVGVISHVEELQQEMGVYVKVENDVEKGSQLSFSWE